ncbi:hypothetical protein P606_23590 [Comamonas thiooxydans]|nr:hypothetical protein P606_23590 [Comamonas thiooxydans]
MTRHKVKSSRASKKFVFGDACLKQRALDMFSMLGRAEFRRSDSLITFM